MGAPALEIISDKEKPTVLRIVGIMTPIDIAKLTKTSVGVRKVALTDIMISGDHLLDEDVEETEFNEITEERKEEIINTFFVNREAKTEGDEVVEGGDLKKATGVFLMSEKKKLDVATRKQRKIEVLESYNKKCLNRFRVTER